MDAMKKKAAISWSRKERKAFMKTARRRLKNDDKKENQGE